MNTLHTFKSTGDGGKMDKQHWKLDNGYEIKELDWDEYQAKIAPYKKENFDDVSQFFNFQDYLSDDEKIKLGSLQKTYGFLPFGLSLCIFKGGSLAGWHMGFQDSPYTYYMGNSVILPEHRHKGLYSEMVKKIIIHTKENGFQTIYSKHMMTNNPVLIAKLKLGFMITKFELSDRNGALLHLKYYTNPIRNKMLQYRAGHIKPDADIKEQLGLE